MTNAHVIQNDTYEQRFGRNIAARLSTGTEDLPHDISERLRAARMQALAKRKVVKLQQAPAVVNNGSSTLTLGSDFGGLKSRLASLIPLAALIAGLLAIAMFQEDVRTKEIAEVDVELLTDDLPPAAYTDPGFAQYLRTQRNH